MPLTRKQVVIAGDNTASAEDFYDSLERQLELPGYFGRNLDALWDMLTGDVEGPLEIIWQEADLSRQIMGDEFHDITALLLEVAEEREDITVTLQ